MYLWEVRASRIGFLCGGVALLLCWLVGLWLVNLSVDCAAQQYESYGRRDPFVPLIGVSEVGSVRGVHGILTVDDVSLQGILVGADGKRSVIINGEVLKEGERVERLLIESIGKNIVTIRIDDDKFELKLYE